MMLDWHADVMHPDLSTPDGTRAMLTARYQHAALTFTAPPQSESGLFEARWNGGQVEPDTEEELFRTLLEELQDCGSQRHDWITVSQAPDPLSPGALLRTQRLHCAYCDTRERVITVPAPSPDAGAGKGASTPGAASAPAPAGGTREHPL
jgi:hypothetical protein